MNTVSLADAEARLSELAGKAEAGETICIPRRGKTVAQIVAVKSPRKSIDIDRLRDMTVNMPRLTESAGDFVREMRDGDRY